MKTKMFMMICLVENVARTILTLLNFVYMVPAFEKSTVQ